MQEKEKIRQFIEKNIIVSREEARFCDNDNIFELGIVSSLFAMKVLNYVQAEFNIAVDSDDMELENFCSVENILQFIERKRSIAV